MENHKCLLKTLKIIPEDLIFDNILPRLPVKSLLRFKSVSTLWNFVICTPHFTNSHLQYSSSLSPHFLFKYKDDIYTIPYNNNLKEPVKLEHSWDYYVEIVGCCNGLICLYLSDNSERYFFVWNPATRQHNKIHSPIEEYSLRNQLVTYGFGSCPTQGVDDHKIIACMYVQNWFWVFSLRTRLWTTVYFPSDYPFYGAQDRIDCIGIYVDHTLYWDIRESDRICICSFSLIDEQFDQEAPLMIPGKEIFHDDSYLCVFKGCLSFIWQWRPDHNDVFVLKKEGDLTSWEKLFSIPFVSNVRFLDFAITGKCLVIHQRHINESVLEHPSDTSREGSLRLIWSGELQLVDPTLEVREHSQGIIYELKHMYSLYQYVESLVSLPPFTLM